MTEEEFKKLTPALKQVREKFHNFVMEISNLEIDNLPKSLIQDLVEVSLFSEFLEYVSSLQNVSILIERLARYNQSIIERIILVMTDAGMNLEAEKLQSYVNDMKKSDTSNNDKLLN